MKKTLRSSLAWASVLVVLVSIFAIPTAVVAETNAPIMEYFYVDGYETATEQVLTGMTASMPITMGVTGEGLVAEGYDSALKISSLGPDGNGLNYAYLVSYPSNSLPFATVPEKLSEWETMKFYLSHEVKAAGAEPRGLQVLLLDQNGGAIAGAYVLFDHCRRDNPTGKFWVELEPSDFYAFPNYSITKTKLTAFPDAYSIGFRIDNYMAAAGENNGKDADGLLTPHYLLYSGGDCWTAIDVYISGLQYARERKEVVDTKTEYFYVDGYETASADTIDSLWIENGSYTGGITTEGRVAEGFDAALKVGFEPNKGWYTAYLYDKETHNRPFTVMPEKLSEWDSIKYYVSPDFDTFTNGIPWGLHCVLLDENGNKLAAAFPLLGTQTGNFWVELKPSDFHQIDYSSGNPVVTATKLTAFPDAYCIGWEINGSFTAVGINGDKDANGQDSAYHYMVYSGYDGYKGGDVYISGLQYVREVAVMPADPTDTYQHTAFAGVENLTQTAANALTSTETLTAGVNETRYVAVGSTNALKIAYRGAQSTGKVAFVNTDGTVPANVMPADLSVYDGMRFHLKAVKDTTALPQYISVALLNGEGNELAEAKINIYDASGYFCDWVYLTPADFGYHQDFPNNAASFAIKMTDTYAAGDSACRYDLYFSGLSYYTYLETENEPSLSMIAGASVRLSAPSGLRFSTKVMGVDTLEQLKANGIITDYRLGTLVAPVDYLTGLTDFTKETVPNALDIVRTKWAAATEEYMQMNAAIVNINTWNYDRGFAARAYLEIDWAVDGSTQILYSDFDISTIDAEMGEHDHIRSVKWAAQKLITMGVYAEGSAEDAVLQEFIRDVSAS